MGQISKLERHTKTLTRADIRRPNLDDAENVQNYQGLDLPSVLVPHETVIRKWTIQAGLRSKMPKRLLTHAVFESVVMPDCRLVFGAELGAMDVKGDTEKTIDETIQRLKILEKAITLRYTPTQVYNAHDCQGLQSTGLEFRLTALGSRHALRQTSTTMLSSDSPVSPESLGILVMVTKNADSTTPSSSGLVKDGLAGLPTKGNVWHGPLIATYKPPQLSPTNSTTRPEISPQRTPNTVAEWIESVPLHISDPLRPLKEMNGVTKSDSVPLDAQTSAESNAMTPIKKKYARVRKVPGTQPIPEASNPLSHDLNRLSHAPELSAVPHDPYCVSPVSQPLAIPQDLLTAPNSPSHNLKLLSSTDQPSETVQDLLTGEEQPSVDYPLDAVLHPTPISALTAMSHPVLTPAVPRATMHPIQDERRSSKTSTKPARSLRASTNFTSQSHSQEQQQPAWMSRNPQVKAREAKKSVSLIDDTEAIPKNSMLLSYAEMAKRGGKKASGASFTDQHYDRLHDTSEVHTRQTHKTMNQKTPKSTDESTLLQTTSSAASQILERTRAYRGIIRLEVDIGRVFVQLSSVPPRLAQGYTFSTNEWRLLFGTPAGSTETLFTNRLPASEKEMRHVTSIKHPDGRNMFSKDPSANSVRYRFLCGSRLGDEDVVLEVSSDGYVQALSDDHIAGAVQWHFSSLWDARIAVKATEQISDYNDAIATLSDSLSVIPSLKKDTMTLSAELGTSSLYFKSAHILRDITFVCQTDPDLAMVCTNVQSLGPVQDRTRFSSSSMDASAVKKGDSNTWWEVRLRSKKILAQLRENENLSMGTLATWEPEKVIGGDVIKRLHSLSADVVCQIDGIGVAGAKEDEQGIS
ncbi:MAG: hypothetical protein Q9174_006136 [Haloplaca sp. 1 TL-2023]